MITCYLRYEIDPFKAKEFETYAKMWLPLVEKFGGTHHGYSYRTKAGTTSRSHCFHFLRLPTTKPTAPRRPAILIARGR
jgi:hypothetical protein